MALSNNDLYNLNVKMRNQIKALSTRSYYYSKNNLRTYNLESTVVKELNFLEFLDPFTKIHSENVAAITLSLCEYLHCTKEFTRACTVCAYLHDIGKTGIPSQILQKTKALTPEEFEIVKKHTTIGYDICVKEPMLKPYARAVRSHHENLDGTGYPDGLKGREIALEAQIIKVADEYDALVSRRQYKSHVDISETVQILADKVKTKKMNGAVLKALIQVINDDILIEIDLLFNYVKKLKDQVRALEESEKLIKGEYKTSLFKSEKYYEIKKAELSEQDKSVLDYINNLDTIRRILSEREELINKLNKELKLVKAIQF